MCSQINTGVLLAQLHRGLTSVDKSFADRTFDAIDVPFNYLDQVRGYRQKERLSQCALSEQI